MTDDVILLVEDNLSDIGLTRRAFMRNGINNPLIVAEDGQEALDYLFGPDNQAVRNLPVLILLDLKLPRVDGMEVLRRIRADPRTRRVPVVILTSSVEELDIAAAYDHGTNSYIRKPVSFDEFAETVRQLGLYWLVTNEPPPTRRTGP